MDKVEEFRALHVPGEPLILINIWDAGSAKAVARAGVKAVATGSYGVAGAQGIDDGEHFPLDAALANLERIAAATDLPVSVDMEAGYGDTPDDVAVSIERVRAAGACGINMEDRMPGESGLLSSSDYCKRVEAAAKSGLFINARCDVFRGQSAETDGPTLVDEVLKRSLAYADAGASGLFVPFLSDKKCIASICEKSPLPVNILRSKNGLTHTELAKLGVARISHGHQPWAAAMAWLEVQAKKVLSGDEPDY